MSKKKKKINPYDLNDVAKHLDKTKIHKPLIERSDDPYNCGGKTTKLK